MSDKIKATITGGDFHDKCVSTSSYGREVLPKHVEWHRMSHVPAMAKFITDRYIKDHVGLDKIAFLLEPYDLHPENYIMAEAARFDYVLTNHKDWADKYDNWLWYPFGGTFLAEEDWAIYDKEGGVSMFITKKDTMPGHKLRHKVFHAFPEIEYYGRGYREVGNKLEGLKDFPFQIVIESCQARGYFTEKLIDCFLTGTVPIYWGDPDIEDVFDLRGMIIWDGDLSELTAILHDIKLDCGAFEMMEDARKLNFEQAKKYVCAEDQIYWRYPELFT